MTYLRYRPLFKSSKTNTLWTVTIIMLTGTFIILVLVSLAYTQPREPDRSFDSCEAALDRGTSNCNGAAPGTRFYYDKEMDNCFQYFYEGCGGGQNTFYDYKSCRTTCIPADKQHCGGNVPVTDTCTRENQKCPAGSKCDVGTQGAGICCDIKNEEEWQKERNPVCKSGKLATKKEWYGDAILLGRSCSHKFCPKGYQCIQTKRLAHCCGGP